MRLLGMRSAAAIAAWPISWISTAAKMTATKMRAVGSASAPPRSMADTST